MQSLGKHQRSPSSRLEEQHRVKKVKIDTTAAPTAPTQDRTGDTVSKQFPLSVLRRFYFGIGRPEGKQQEHTMQVSPFEACSKLTPFAGSMIGKQEQQVRNTAGLALFHDLKLALTMCAPEI